MTTFWSLYVTVLTLGTIFALTWLLLATRKGQRSEQTDEKVGQRSTASKSTTTQCRNGGSCCLWAP